MAGKPVLDPTSGSSIVTARVLLLTPDTSGPGGVAHYYRTLALPQSSDVEYFFVNRAVPETTAGRAGRLAANYVKFLAKLLGGHVRMVHLNPSFDRKSFYRDAVFCAFALLLQKRVLVHFRGWDERFVGLVRGSWWRRMLANNTFGRARHFLVLGMKFESDLRELGFSGRFWRDSTVAEALTERLDLEEKARPLPNQVRILFMSRIIRAKGIYVALDAVAGLRRRFPGCDISLVVAGDGEEAPEARRYAVAQEMSFVSFVGEVRGSEKSRILRDSHILLFPTFHGEGLPNVILEAMLHGLPVVCRDAGAISDVVIDGRNGLVTSAESAAEFTDMLARLISEPRLYAAMSRRNAAVAGERYVCAAVRERLLRVYNEVLKGEGSSLCVRTRNSLN